MRLLWLGRWLLNAYVVALLVAGAVTTLWLVTDRLVATTVVGVFWFAAVGFGVLVALLLALGWRGR